MIHRNITINAKKSIEGATWARRDGQSDGHMTIKHDGNDCDATVLLFEQPPTSATDTNFIILQNIDVKEEDVQKISISEQHRIDKGIKNSRSGPAGGILQVLEKRLRITVQPPQANLQLQYSTLAMVWD